MIRGWLVVLLVVGCESTPREAFDCTCSYLTDTDVPGVERAAVCVERGKQPESAASECVSGMGVGSIEKCSCKKAERLCSGAACGNP